MKGTRKSLKGEKEGNVLKMKGMAMKREKERK